MKKRAIALILTVAMIISVSVMAVSADGFVESKSQTKMSFNDTISYLKNLDINTWFLIADYTLEAQGVIPEGFKVVVEKNVTLSLKAPLIVEGELSVKGTVLNPALIVKKDSGIVQFPDVSIPIFPVYPDEGGEITDEQERFFSLFRFNCPICGEKTLRYCSSCQNFHCTFCTPSCRDVNEKQICEKHFVNCVAYCKSCMGWMCVECGQVHFHEFEARRYYPVSMFYYLYNNYYTGGIEINKCPICDKEGNVYFCSVCNRWHCLDCAKNCVSVPIPPKPIIPDIPFDYIQYIISFWPSNWMQISYYRYLYYAMISGQITLPDFDYIKWETFVPYASVKNNATVPFGTKVSLGTPGGVAQIYYTLDGTEPTNKSQLYIEPIALVEKAVEIKAVAYIGQMRVSRVVTFTYKTEVPFDYTDVIKNYPAAVAAIKNLVEKGILKDSDILDTEATLSYDEVISMLEEIGCDVSKANLKGKTIADKEKLTFDEMYFVTFRVLSANKLVEVSRKSATMVLKALTHGSEIKTSASRAAISSMYSAKLVLRKDFAPYAYANRISFLFILGTVAK